jgi:hypothetical protein
MHILFISLLRYINYILLTRMLAKEELGSRVVATVARNADFPTDYYRNIESSTFSLGRSSLSAV